MDNSKKLLIKLNPDNDPTELNEMLMAFEAHGLKLEGGILSIPENYTIINENNHLIMVLPNRIDFAICLKPEEYLVIADKQ